MPINLQHYKLDFRSCVLEIKQLLSSKQMGVRVKGCKQRLFWSQDHWKKVLFSDESIFCVFHGKQGIRILRFKKEAFPAERLKHSLKFATSVMVWGCMIARGPHTLCIVYKKIISEVY